MTLLNIATIMIRWFRPRPSLYDAIHAIWLRHGLRYDITPCHTARYNLWFL